ncbi:ATP-binding protein [Mesorhizobium sp. CO1-1-7]|uniref:AAA family ATPase n=1 Tax=Mesorhizobium sp. CO1-1-7 TaxID=2876632 RepID=UPI001CD16A4C|nr:AAA family ATPase [Mesorhizobium sp. CO1-1-7]MBZ9748296.1 ATP-binding protein [Mesorhizobium sp. CO1-1-7]
MHKDDVFVAGGQPTVTYIDRQELHVERSLARALATPNQIVSLAGPTKTGKTVLCKKMLGEREYVWIDGGQIKTPDDLWNKITAELNIPYERASSHELAKQVEGGVSVSIVSAGGSRLSSQTAETLHRVDGMAEALLMMQQRRVILVIDDFHYIDPESRKEVVRNLKGAIFNGLKVLLLSVAHRVFDAISAESELTGRFISVTLPDWNPGELEQIATLGFRELKVDCPAEIVSTIVAECQSSPFLMQKFCWEICFDNNVEKPSLFGRTKIPDDYDLKSMFTRIAQDAGLPIYQKLVAGPQARKERLKRPLKSGEEADIYEATLLAIAETGPLPSISYDDLRSKMSNLLTTEMMPQKHEITSALKHLANISLKGGLSSAVDWDEERREVSVADPYLRFFLRWQVRGTAPM